MPNKKSTDHFKLLIKAITDRRNSIDAATEEDLKNRRLASASANNAISIGLTMALSLAYDEMKLRDNANTKKS